MYVVCQKGTKKCLPVTKHNRGHTWTEPVEYNHTKDTIPRLFATKQAATAAIRWWKLGKCEIVGDDYGNFHNQKWYDTDERRDIELVVCEANIYVYREAK